MRNSTRRAGAGDGAAITIEAPPAPRAAMAEGVFWVGMESPHTDQQRHGPLRLLLRERRARLFVADAELIRDHSESPDRTAEAERLVRECMLQFGLGNISDDERRRIFEILAFAIPPLPEALIDTDVRRSDP